MTHRALSLGIALSAAVLFGPVGEADAARRQNSEMATQFSTPPIRQTADNAVPACVTPDRLMRFLHSQNGALEPKYEELAQDYRRYGDELRVRWDFAFYQMLLETNYLKFGHDVKPKQNNFAGIGATGGGVPGESFPDVATGVLAQIQHLVAYSGDVVPDPVAKRTRENQDGIIAQSKRLGRPVRFGDLTNRWAADNSYARSIMVVADHFRTAYCGDAGLADATDPPKGANLARAATTHEFEPPRSSLGGGIDVQAPPQCQVMAASYGGAVTLLIRAETDQGVILTALDVTGGSEDVQAADYINAHARGGRIAGRYKNQSEAVSQAYQMCDSGRP
jgi:hypothetical protein